jgi:hypothetical protein
MKRLKRLLLSSAVVTTAIWAISPAVSYGAKPPPPPPPPPVSINSTSANSLGSVPTKPVTEQAIVPNKTFTILGVNDLGMHCGDLDTRIASILPPYNVLHAQVIQKGTAPRILDTSTVSVVYSAASSRFDIVFEPGNLQPPGFNVAGPCNGVKSDGSPNCTTLFGGVYKTNFWDALNAGAYNAFYPFDIVMPPVTTIPTDLGLLAPDPAFLPSLVAAQEAMPGIKNPYVKNDAQKFARFDSDLPFFRSFAAFGYEQTNLNWFSADGIPLTTIDDSARVNPYPLMRLAAVDNKTKKVLATIDTVTPVSGEANCRLCHTNNDPSNGGIGGYTATAQGVSVDHVDANGNVDNPGNMAAAWSDPKYGAVPLPVSVEYAQDLNVLRYHDRSFGNTNLTRPTYGYRDSAGSLTTCTISRWKYRPAAGFNSSNGTPATPLVEENTIWAETHPGETVWPDGSPNCLSYKATNGEPVVCQTCHYTPALDLAQVGPIGGSGAYTASNGDAKTGYDDGTGNGGLIDCPTGTGGYDPTYGNCVANGRAQRNKPSMSDVIHTRHASFSTTFPMPSPADTAAREYIVTGPLDTTCNRPNSSGVQAQPGSRVYAQCEACTNKPYAECVVENTCYNCHPGRYTKCLRGVMGANGMLCQDCHGALANVGNDFSAGLSPTNPFPVGADLTKRVPWAIEPGCQSCHVGDAINKPADTTGFIFDDEGIRLLQAWRTGDTNATPIASPNSRFAEDQTPSEFGQTGPTKRILFRLSRGQRTVVGDTTKQTMFTGHNGVMCEGCHGPTHAEWPVSPDAPNDGTWPPPSGSFVANDNVTAGQLQGHTGKIVECKTCHTGAFSLQNGLGGPHGLHPVGGTNPTTDPGYSQWWVDNHGHYLNGRVTAEKFLSNCGVCHGDVAANARGTGQGSPLAEMAQTRTLSYFRPDPVTLEAGHKVICGDCHSGVPLLPAGTTVAAAP